MASPGGYASKAEQAQRADKMRRLAEDGITPANIALRVGLSPSKVREELHAMGLRKHGERAYS